MKVGIACQHPSCLIVPRSQCYEWYREQCWKPFASVAEHVLPSYAQAMVAAFRFTLTVMSCWISGA